MSDEEVIESEVVIGARELLLHLVAEASEIEHTLMCSNLYAAFSLKRKGETRLSRAEADAAERWRKTIMSVAIEERRRPSLRPRSSSSDNCVAEEIAVFR